MMGRDLTSKSTAGRTDHALLGDNSAASRSVRKRYGPPRLIVSEPLELAAGTCSPPTGPFGKTFVPPSTCTQLGS